MTKQTNIIIEQRKLLGWTQSQLSEYSGLSLRTIQRVEKGDKISVETAKCLAATFNLDYNLILQNNNLTNNFTKPNFDNKSNKQQTIYLVSRFIILNLIIFLINLLFNKLFGHHVYWSLYVCITWGIFTLEKILRKYYSK